ncbi:long-chain acyl-CoA synthetase [Geomicrobium halophilum]|uniref:Long-chain acyl-CoA synthetase n=1 Tax=Geomicrobium halophilum TaxID=549000 RepID=A0A841PMP3_9BACL|nr:AMP-binding protein [Geomicrobium halophilum]MBB6450117.1 long-chain acyl-CoA synthetase [Geomicrobium halophilum]
MERIWMKNWPTRVPTKLHYSLGEKPLHEYLHHHAEEKPDQSAYIFYGTSISWQELDRYSDSLACYLQRQGVQKGDRIGIYMQNCPQYMIAHYAIQKIGAIVSPFNPMSKEAELAYMVEQINAKGIITGQELYPFVKAVKDKSENLEIVVTTNYLDFLSEGTILPIPEEVSMEKQTFEEAEDLLDIIRTYQPNFEAVPINIWEDVSLMVFTSGTTGRPKAAMLTYGNALFKTASTFEANGLNYEDRSVAVMPLCHIAGMVMGVNLPVYSGSTSVLLTRFEPETVITAMEQYKPQNWYSIVPMNMAILHHPGIETRDLTSLNRNMCTSFGMPITQDLVNQWKKVTEGCQLHEAAYGLSETHTCDTFMPADNVKLGSCGIPTHETDIRIVDLESGEDLPTDKEGEIAVKNPGVFKGYWNRPEATAETLRDGWVFTGDIGYIDGEGYLYFSGRVKEMIKSSGYSVFPEDVEALLIDHKAIAQVAVIGVPDEKKGESVKAFVVLHPQYKGKISETEIVDWAKEKMAAYKYPRYVEFLQSVPATGSGKVLRRLLKEEVRANE